MGILYQTESSLTACSSLVTVWCMSQTSRYRNNSRRVRTHEKNSGETVRRLGTIIQSIFCAQSGADIRLKFWKWLGESRYPGAFSPVLENFRRALSSDPTDCPWVSEDGFSLATESSRSRNQNVKLIRSSETVSVDPAYDTMVYDSVSVSFFICQKKIYIHTDIPCRVSYLYNGHCRDLELVFP